MRIQTRLFLGIAVLVLALMAGQWWLHLRQLRAVEEQLTTVAATVGKGLLTGDLERIFRHQVELVGDDCDEPGRVEVIAVGDAATVPDVQVRQIHRVTKAAEPEGEDAAITARHRYTMAWVSDDGDDAARHFEEEIVIDAMAFGGSSTQTHHIKLEVVDDSDNLDRFLVITDPMGEASKIPIPVTSAVREMATVQRQGLVFGAGLLVVGLVASGLMANRMSRPLRDLAARAERLGSGDLGGQVEVTASGEVGDLQRAFNEMSSRLARLEDEREAWRRREHLAQLGDLSRGLAHTLRNPLNTLGLAVEELASAGDGQDELVRTARGQIGRIDRWLRSFLALGAGDAAEVELVPLAETTRAAVLETVQAGHHIEVVVEDDEVEVSVVSSALRAALANLLENAVEARPAEAPVEVRIGRRGEEAVVEIADRGPGLPEEVRERLFSPHVTTKTGGSGMGLFLARQLIVNMHGGRLDVGARDGGGTLATILLPVARPGEPA